VKIFTKKIHKGKKTMSLTVENLIANFSKRYIISEKQKVEYRKLPVDCLIEELSKIYIKENLTAEELIDRLTVDNRFPKNLSDSCNIKINFKYFRNLAEVEYLYPSSVPITDHYTFTEIVTSDPNKQNDQALSEYGSDSIIDNINAIRELNIETLLQNFPIEPLQTPLPPENSMGKEIFDSQIMTFMSNTLFYCSFSLARKKQKFSDNGISVKLKEFCLCFFEDIKNQRHCSGGFFVFEHVSLSGRINLLYTEIFGKMDISAPKNHDFMFRNTLIKAPKIESQVDHNLPSVLNAQENSLSPTPLN
jgi:hypothetical protein